MVNAYVCMTQIITSFCAFVLKIAACIRIHGENKTQHHYNLGHTSSHDKYSGCFFVVTYKQHLHRILLLCVSLNAKSAS
jgi:hypothetical protein